MSKEPEENRWLWKRRSFLKAGASGIALTATGWQCTSPRPQDTESEAALQSFELDEVTIDQLQSRMESGELTARRITELYLDRIEKTNLSGPELRAINEVNPDALEIADALDRERAEQGPRGPLHGIPIVLKDNIDTHDGMTTTAGSLALEGSVPSRDSFVASRLREAGAVLLGKTNLSEWANFRSEHSSSGWSARGGQCRNPYALDRNPCGSSSGSGVASSANLAAGAIGTETDGSIVCPSNANGIVGIKPTVGLVGRTGIIPISHTQDTAGPMARTVRDAALILNALVGVDPDDAATTDNAARAGIDYTSSLTTGNLDRFRIGICRDFFGFNPDVDSLMEASVGELGSLGATVVEEVSIPSRRALGRPSYQVLLYEFKAGLNAYLKTLGPEVRVKSLEDVIQFNDEHSGEEMPFFGQDVFLLSQEKGDLQSEEYLEALEQCRELSRDKGIDAVMAEKELDVLVAPTGGPAWMTDHINGDHFSGSSSSPAAISGYPNVTVPMGTVHGLPVGISFFGKAWSEPVLIQVAYAFEQATQARRKPGLLPTIDI